MEKYQGEQRKTINTLVYDTSVSAARPYYKPLKASRSGDIVILGGNLYNGKQNDAVNAVFNVYKENGNVDDMDCNNADLVRSALKRKREIEIIKT